MGNKKIDSWNSWRSKYEETRYGNANFGDNLWFGN